MLGFSLSFPATVWALTGFGAWTSTGLRGVIAGVAAGAVLMLTRSRWPQRADLPGLAMVAVGCAIGFPLLTTLALQTSSTAHSAVVIGALPMATAVISTVLTGKRQPVLFWLGSVSGGLVVVLFSLLQSKGLPTLGDAFLFGALVLCAAGYAEGGRLSGHLPGWQVIAWGVVLALPVNVVVSVVALPLEPVHYSGRALVGLGYIALVSQFGAFIPWYQGMAVIGVARASQIQLAQPLLTLLWAVVLLDESLTPLVPVTAGLVLLCIVITQRAKTTGPVPSSRRRRPATGGP